MEGSSETAAEDELTLGNSTALNALFNGVDKNMFRLIKQCIVAKDAWKILKTAHEGSTKVESQTSTSYHEIGEFENAG